MKCNHEFILRAGTAYAMSVPCGQCIACRINKTQQWSMRILHESGYWNKSVFLTLTYDDDHIPLDNSINRKTLQALIKSLRNDNHTIKYFACGEYGEKTQRPHYHAIIFGLGPEDEEIIKQEWPFGFVYCGTVTSESAQYVAGYIQKKITGKGAPDVYQKRQAPFQLQSQGLGKQWALDNREYLNNNEYITIKGKPFPIPRYYREVLEIDFADRMADYAQEHEYDYRNHLAERGITPLEASVYRGKQKVQRERNAIARTGIIEKKL